MIRGFLVFTTVSGAALLCGWSVCALTATAPDDCVQRPRRPVQEGVRVDGRYRVSLQAPGALICLADRNRTRPAKREGTADEAADECRSLKLLPAPDYSGDRADANLYGLVDDQRTVLATIRITEGTSTVRIAAYALPSGRRLRNFTVDVQSISASLFALLDDHLYVRDCVGAGPGCVARLYPLLAQKTQPFAVRLPAESSGAADGDDLLNMYEGSEIRSAAGRWLFVSATGERVVWMDFAKGRAIRGVILADRIPGVAAQDTAFPWLAQNADPSTGNFAYRTEGALDILFGLYETSSGGDGRYWRARLDFSTGELISSERIKLCPSS